MSELAPNSRKAARLMRRAALLNTVPDPLLTAEEAAGELGIAVPTFWRDIGRGRLPPPRYVTPRSPRWRRSELHAVVDAAPRTPQVPSNRRRKRSSSEAAPHPEAERVAAAEHAA